MDSLSRPKKKESDKEGSRLVIRNIKDAFDYTLDFVKSYTFAKESPKFLSYSAGDKKQLMPGAYLFEVGKNVFNPLHTDGSDYKLLTFSEDGSQVGFIANLDTTKIKPEPFHLFHAALDNVSQATEIANNETNFLPKGWMISPNGRLQFSKDNTKLFFGTAPEPILQDTSILDEEIVNVEVWTYKDETALPAAKCQTRTR